MRIFYVDETGFTGEDLVSRDQPIFAQASVDYSNEEAKSLINKIFSPISVKELKHSSLKRNDNHRRKIVDLVEAVAKDPSRATIWIAHKEFAMVTQVVQWWVEPLAYQTGLNLYQDGANLAMANMMYFCLKGFWSESFRYELLLAFQKMLRTRAKDHFDDCQALVNREFQRAGDHQKAVLTYFQLPFKLLGFPHVVQLPRQVLDIALPGLIQIAHVWRSRHDDYAEVVHDQSSNTAKQKWLWDGLTSSELEQAAFDFPGIKAIFPMRIAATRFADSVSNVQLQICDILAGAASEAVRSVTGESGSDYAQALWKAGLDNLLMGGIWPRPEVTSEELGTMGVDGNQSIEWITNQFRRTGLIPPD